MTVSVSESLPFVAARRGGPITLLLVVGLFFVGAVMVPVGAKAASAATATEAITAFHEKLIGAVRASDGKGFDARQKVMAPVIKGIFDANFMAKYAVGDTLDKFSADQQKELVSSFSDMTVANYASRFKNYNGQRFEVLSEGPSAQFCDQLRSKFEAMGSKKLPKECVLVKSQFIKSNGETKSINYRVYRTADAAPWQIVDVLSGPASELATRRSEFSTVARNEGPAALLNMVKNKVIKLAQDTSADATSAIP